MKNHSNSLFLFVLSLNHQQRYFQIGAQYHHAVLANALVVCSQFPRLSHPCACRSICVSTQTEADWNGGARMEDRFIAFIHTGPECFWRHRVGVLHMAGTGRMAGLSDLPQPFRLPEKVRQARILFFFTQYVPLQMTMNPAVMVSQLWGKMPYSFCKASWLCWGSLDNAHL